MLRQKFIDRLRKKYQTGGENTETRNTTNLFGGNVTKLNVPTSTPIEPSGLQKSLSFGAKALKYAPAVARFAGSKALGPLSLLLGSTKAYAPPVVDPETGVHRYSGEQAYTPFQTGGMYNPQSQVVPWQGTQMMKHGGRPEYAEYHDLPQEEYDQAVMEYQQGGMYNQMRQYQTGGQTLPNDWQSEIYEGQTLPDDAVNPKLQRIDYKKEEMSQLEDQLESAKKRYYELDERIPINSNRDAVEKASIEFLNLEQLIAEKKKQRLQTKISRGTGKIPLSPEEMQTGGVYDQSGKLIPNKKRTTYKLSNRDLQDIFLPGGGLPFLPNFSSQDSSHVTFKPGKTAFATIDDEKGNSKSGNISLKNRKAIEDKGRKIKFQQGGMYNQMQQYQGGGMALPGGLMAQIPGTDAVEFEGADHDEGGIELDPQTEVEDGETMDQVTMARGGGQRKDYFFSSHLKKGGKSFADMHKDILREGGDQQEIDWLASMQEKAAGRNSNKVGTAKLGGVMKYQTGGEDYLYDDDDITYTDVPPADQTREQYYADMSNPPYNINPALVTSDDTRDYNKYLESLNPQDRSAMSFEDWIASRGEDKLSAKDKLKNLFKKKELTDEEIYKRSLKREVPLGAYAAGLAQLAPAAYSFLHKQPEAQQVEYTSGVTSPIIAEKGRASKLERVNYNVERARNAADMRAINKYIEISGGGPANIINKMMAYSKKQQGDMQIASAETRANQAIANKEAELAQQMELSNLQRAQQASITTAQLAQQEAARADQVEAINAAARQKRVDDMEYMKYQGISATVQGISGIVGDVLDYRAQERLAKMMGSEGIYERENIIDFLMKEGMTKKEAKIKARELYNEFNPTDA